MISFFVELWTDDWLGKIMAVLFAGCAALVAWLIYLGVYYAADSWFVVPQPGRATVIDHQYTAAWTQTIVHNTGKTSWVQIIHHPESWSLVMQMEDGRTDTFGVNQETWQAVKEGRTVDVTFKEGRISGGAYVVTADL